MDFDPKAFLATPPSSGGGFDPHAFLNPSSDTISQEMHPDFTDADRLVVSNFSNNNEASVNYLQKRYPNLEIAVDKGSGQIKARRRDGSDGGNYRVLNPDLGVMGELTSPKELLRDIGGHAYGLGSTALSTLASGAAGVAGAGAGGIGALPAAMAAGGATGSGLELLKQKIGQALGIPQNTELAPIALAGAAGAATPLLAGTGATAGQIAKGVMQGGEKEALETAQQGMIARAADSELGQKILSYLGKGAAKTGGALTGIPSEQLQAFAENPDSVELASKNKSLLKALGGYLGYKVGSSGGHGLEGAYLGSKVGDAMGAPQMVERYIRAGIGTKQALEAIPPAARNMLINELATKPAVQSAWERMQK